MKTWLWLYHMKRAQARLILQPQTVTIENRHPWCENVKQFHLWKSSMADVFPFIFFCSSFVCAIPLFRMCNVIDSVLVLSVIWTDCMCVWWWRCLLLLLLKWMQSGQIYYERCAFAWQCYCVHTTQIKQSELNGGEQQQQLKQQQQPYKLYADSSLVSHRTCRCIFMQFVVVVLLPANKEIKFDAIDSLISCGDAVVKC